MLPLPGRVERMNARTADEDLQRLYDLAADGRYQAAVDHCFSVLDDGDIDRGFWTMQIGLLYFLNYWETGGLFEEAPRFAEQAVWLAPHSPDAHFWYGWISQIAFSDNNLARREYLECLDLVPEHPYAHLALGSMDLPPEETKQHLLQILDLQPSNYRALMLFADAGLRLDEHSLAAATLNHLLDCRPFVENGYGIMNDYINDVFNGAYRQDEIAEEARTKLEELRPYLA